MRKKGSGKHCIVHRGYLLFKTLTHGEFLVNAKKMVKPHDHKTVKTLNKCVTEIPGLFQEVLLLLIIPYKNIGEQ